MVKNQVFRCQVQREQQFRTFVFTNQCLDDILMACFADVVNGFEATVSAANWPRFVPINDGSPGVQETLRMIR